MTAIVQADQLYQPLPSIAQRFPQLDGNLLQAAVFEVYAVREDVTLSYFRSGSNIEPLLSRHPENNRRQRRTREAYASDMLTKGMFVGVRGEPWAVEGEHGTYALMSGATMVEAVYDAFKTQPANKYVLRTLANGLKHCTVFHKRTPTDVLRYLKTLHNDIRSGAATSHVEVLSQLGEYLADWGNHSRKQLGGSRACPTKGDDTYRKQRLTYINGLYQDGQHRFENPYQLGRVSNLFNTLNRLKFFEAYSETAEAFTNFLHPRYSKNTVLNVSVDILTVVMKFQSSMRPIMFKHVMMQALLLAVPTDSQAATQTFELCTSDTIEGFMFPMEGSVILEGTAVTPAKRGRAAKTTGSTGKQRKAKAKAAPAQAQMPSEIITKDVCLEHEVLAPDADADDDGAAEPEGEAAAETPPGGQRTRPKMLLDCLVSAVESVIGGIADGDVQWGEVDIVLRRGMEFPLVVKGGRSNARGGEAKGVDALLPPTEGSSKKPQRWSRWSQVQAGLRNYLWHMHAGIEGLPVAEPEVVDSQSAGGSLQENDSKDQIVPMDIERPVWEHDLKVFLSGTSVDELKAAVGSIDFASAHCSRDHFAKIVQGVRADAAVIPGNVSISVVLSALHLARANSLTVVEGVRSAIAVPLIQGCDRHGEGKGLKPQVPAVMADVFDTTKQCEDFAFDRVFETVQVIGNTSTGFCKVTGDDFTAALQKVSTIPVSVLGRADVLMTSSEMWVEFWSTLLGKASKDEVPAVLNFISKQVEKRMAAINERDAAIVERAKVDSDDSAHDVSKLRAVDTFMHLMCGWAEDSEGKLAAPQCQLGLETEKALSSNSPVHPMVIRRFMAKLELFLYDVTSGSNSDKGTQNVYIDYSGKLKDTELIAKPVCNDIVLNLVGHVSNIATQNAIPICEAFGMKFYVQDPVIKVISGEVFNPGWLVRESQDEPTMEFKTTPHALKFVYSQAMAAREKSITVEVTIPRLEISAASLGKPSVLLSRPPIPGQVSTSVAKDHAAKSTQIVMAAAGNAVDGTTPHAPAGKQKGLSKFLLQ